MRRAISSPLSSCRKCDAPGTNSGSPAVGMSFDIAFAAPGGKIGSESLK